jgi:hypothetical protein
MRHVEFDPTRLNAEQQAWLAKWEQEAEKATAAVIAAYENGEAKLPFDSKIWGDLKEWLLDNVFHGKCSYCEIKIVRASADAEHYRPKSAVTVRDPVTKKLVPVKAEDASGAMTEHPGYFWLAYNRRNLLPSCEACNRRRGKLTQFVVAQANGHVFMRKFKASEVQRLPSPPIASKRWQGWYYLAPESLDALESPLLLHPLRDDPAKALMFGEWGYVTPVDESPVGKASIAVYDLEAEDLRIARQREQEIAWNNYHAAKQIRYGEHLTRQDLERRAQAVLDAYQGGMEQFTAAVLGYFVWSTTAP